MAKRKKNQQDSKNSKKANVKKSNALLPARGPDEEPVLQPDIPIKVKTEAAHDIESLMSLIDEAKTRTNASDDDASSDASTIPEQMETNESINCRIQQNLSENSVVPTSFGETHVKQEPLETYSQSEQLASSHTSLCKVGEVQEFAPNENINTLSDSVDSNSVSNVFIKKEPLEKEEFSTNVVCDPTVPVNKKESVEESENNERLQNEIINHDKVPTDPPKRKNFEYEFQLIRKRFKTEKIDGEDMAVPPNENVNTGILSVADAKVVNENGSANQLETRPIDPEQNIQSTHADGISEEIAILPEVEKFVPVIDLCLSDDDEEEKDETSTVTLISDMETNQNSLHIPSSSTLTANSATSSLKKNEQRNFSTDILKYFNVVSELDRYDCKTTLEYLSKYNTQSILQNFFPIIKKEKKSTCNIEKGDILFKKLTETESEDASLSGSVISDKIIIQPTAEKDSLCNSFPSTSAVEIRSPLATFPVTSAALPLSSHISAPALHQSTLVPLQFPTSNPSLNSNMDTTPNSMIVTSPTLSSDVTVPDISVAALKQIIDSFPIINAPSMPANGNTLVPVIDHNQRPSLQDPRCKSILPSSGSGNSVPISSTAVVTPQVPPVLSPNLSARLAKPSLPARANIPPAGALSVNRDPRISANKVTWAPRKGTKDLFLYLNIGKDDVTEHFEKIVLQWNPAWLEMQNKSFCCPPICSSYPNVGYFYANEMAYYNTYVPLHFLHVWFGIFDCWMQKKSIIINCKCQSVEKVDHVFKISCSTELDEEEVWPKGDDIAWCKYGSEEAFLRVEYVRKRPINLETRKKLKMSLESLHDLKLREGDAFNFCILFNIRTAILETKALKALDNNMKDLVLKPENHTESFEIANISQSKGIKNQRNDIMKVVELNHASIILIETGYTCDVNLLLTQLAYHIAFGQKPKDPNQPPPRSFRSKVLICLKNEQNLEKILKRLGDYKPVLAVRAKQLSLSKEEIKRTIEDRLDKGETLNKILNSSHIFITTFSSFGTAEKSHMSKIGRLTCIVDEAHMCSELETTLLLTLKLTKVLLMGNKLQGPRLPSILINHRYNISFFIRLLKAKQSY